MFLGEFQHSLDGKGRIILPAKFRARLAQGCVLTAGQDRCLYVYSPEEWQSVSDRLRGTKVSNAQVRNFQRFIFSHASEESPDGQGRVLVPEALRRYASLDRDISVIGVGSRIEIWDRARWETQRSQAEQSYAEMAESSDELPF